MPNTLERLQIYLRAHAATVPSCLIVREFPSAPLFVSDLREAVDAFRKTDAQVLDENAELRGRVKDLENAASTVLAVATRALVKGPDDGG